MVANLLQVPVMLMTRPILISLVTLAASTCGMADVFDFSFSSSIFSLTNGTLTATSNGDGSFTATAGSATFSYAGSGLNYSVTLVTPPGAIRLNGGDVAVTDNLIFPNNPYYFVDYTGGLAFTRTGGQLSALGGVYLSANFNPPTNVIYGFSDITPPSPSYASSTDGVLSLVAAPEPSAVITLLIMLTGVGAYVGVSPKRGA